MIPNNKIYFKLFAQCILVKGAMQSVICDLQRQNARVIPESLYEVIQECSKYSIQELKAMYEEQVDILQEYLDFLVNNEFGFYTDEPERFPEMDLYWNEPALITNAIIDVSATSAHDFKDIFTQLENIGCQHIQIRFFSQTTVEELEEIIGFLTTSRIKSLELIVPHAEHLTMESAESLCEKHLRIHSLTIHSAPENIVPPKLKMMGNVFFTKQVIDNHTHCGIISPELFKINLKTFSESQKYNSCLNRKVSVDTNGDIKNCPSMAKAYGNIKQDSLHNIIIREQFKELWEINKDQIDVCQDCEFRYICTDCRAFISDENDIYSKPSKCNYDPYTATWQ